MNFGTDATKRNALYKLLCFNSYQNKNRMRVCGFTTMSSPDCAWWTRTRQLSLKAARLKHFLYFFLCESIFNFTCLICVWKFSKIFFSLLFTALCNQIMYDDIHTDINDVLFYVHNKVRWRSSQVFGVTMMDLYMVCSLYWPNRGD